MVNNENFDNFLREKGESANFDFTENDWALAKDLIAIKTEETKKKRFLIVGFIIMISLSVLFSLLCNHYLPMNAEKKLNANPKKSVFFSNQKLTKANDLRIEKSSTLNPTNLAPIPNNKKTEQHLVNMKKNIVAQVSSANQYVNKNGKESLLDFIIDDVNQTIIGNIDLIDCRKLNPIILKEVPYSFNANLVNTSNHKLLNSKPSSFHYWLDAGLTFYNPGNSLVSNLNFYAGIETDFDFSKKFGLQSGFIFSRLNQNQQERVINERVFSFEAINQTKTIRTILLDYIEVPISLRYYISSRHSFQAGISFMYVVNSSEVLKISRDDEHGNDVVSLLNNFRTHVNDFDYQLQFKHNYLIGKKLMLKTGLYYGLNDISKNNGNNIGLRLGLGYQLY